jgi:hypothetical protein
MTTAEPFHQGPYLIAAVICEKILEERDGVKSAIRMVDRLTRTVVAPSPPAQMEPFEYEFALLVRFKAGAARGPYELMVRLTKPSGESPPPMRDTLHFEGEDDRGVDVNAGMRIKFDETGVYWFDVYLADTRITRVPFRVVYTPRVAPAGN